MKSLDLILRNLEADEQQIAEAALVRLNQGRMVYGPWQVKDSRDYPEEALEEIIDALHYCAAELVRLRRLRAHPEVRPSRVYVCHPLAGDVRGNVGKVRAICRALIATGYVPIAPHLFLSEAPSDTREQDEVIAACLHMVDACDELRVHGGVVTASMGQEIARASAIGVPVCFMPEVV